MTIKQQGGIFGRRPTFENVTVDGTLIVDQVVERTPAAGITLEGVTFKDGHVALASGKGIDFSATAGTGTSELLDDYEEGEWTPTVTAGSGSITSYTSSGTYTKIGRLVFATATITITNNGTGASFIDTSLPFASANERSIGSGREATSTGSMLQWVVSANGTTAAILTYNNQYPATTGDTIYVSLSYNV